MDAIGIAVRFALYLDLMAIGGLAGFAVWSLRGADRVLPMRGILVVLAGLGLALSVGGLLAQAAAMAGVPIMQVDRATLTLLLGGTATGTAWLVRMAALVVASIAALAGRRGWPVVALAGAVALATLAWTGHGTMDDGRVGLLHLAADVAHLIAAAAWFGALIGLLALVAGRADPVLTHRALAGFGGIGTAIVGVIVATGLVNTWLLVGPAGVPRLFDTSYGRWLLAKLGLFGGMVLLAAANRYRLTPRFERALASGDDAGARAALRRSIVLETLCAVGIFAIVAWIGTLEPPASR